VIPAARFADAEELHCFQKFTGNPPAKGRNRPRATSGVDVRDTRRSYLNFFDLWTCGAYGM
jgi:hypothetical protein